MTNHWETLKQDLNCLIDHNNVYHQLVYQVLIQRYQKEHQERNCHCGLEMTHGENRND